MKKIIARISNGFGNQMFVYATAYAFAKKMGYDLYLDIDTALNQSIKKHKIEPYMHWDPKYELNIFNISAKIAPHKLTFNSKIGYLKRKMYKIMNKFYLKKIFLIEKKDNKKRTRFSDDYLNFSYDNKIFFEGLFESEKYFIDYKNDIKKEFSFNKIPEVNNKYLNLINESNSVSIAIRRDRFSEKFRDQNNFALVNKTKEFEKSTFEYIFNSIKMIKNKISNPKFFIFSDNFNGLDKIFDKKLFIFVDEFYQDKSAEDFYLLKHCKHFIVGPTSFHWWAAWLCNYENKIILRPKCRTLNISSNIDFWPESWNKI